MSRACFYFGLTIAAVSWSQAGALAQQGASDQDVVYRLQPTQSGTEQVVVPASEVKRGLVYNYYNEKLGRHAWGFAAGNGKFSLAFGAGSVMPTTRFDLRLSPEAETRILERGAPGLMEALQTTGSKPVLQLNEDDRWELLGFRSIARVFDLETGHRWEWHGGRRKAVLHTYGDQWQIVDGHYVPATGPVLSPLACPSLVRAGSIVFVVRTP